MWELDYKESWVQKNWCFWTVVFEKTLESPLETARRSNQSILKEISEYSLEGLMLKLKLQYQKNQLIVKDPDAGKDWRREEKGVTENETVGWDHWLNGHEFEWTLEVGDGQGGLGCCSPWGHKELDRVEWLNWTELKSLFSNTGTFYDLVKEYLISDSLGKKKVDKVWSCFFLNHCPD